MRTAPLLFAAFTVATSTLSGCATTPAPQASPAPAAFSATDRTAVVAVLEAQRDAWNRGDLEAYMAGYARSEELIFTSGSRIRRGWQQAFDAYRNRYGSAPETMGKLGFEILGVQSLGADGAVILGRWMLTETENAGSGVFSVVLERQADGWKVVHDHTSSDPSSSESPE